MLVIIALNSVPGTNQYWEIRVELCTEVINSNPQFILRQINHKQLKNIIKISSPSKPLHTDIPWWHFDLLWVEPLFQSEIVKGGFILKIKQFFFYLYFIATQYLWSNALLVYMDNWTQSFSLVIIYWNCQF